MSDQAFSHPYIPNASPRIAREMMDVMGAKSEEDFYTSIPSSLRSPREMDLPEPLESELDLRRHVEGILAENQSCSDLVCFRGGGCAWHYVPAVCDEVNGRAEFLTAYAGEPYEDHGRFQALFEYSSLMGELLDLDVVSIPTFDWNQAASTACRMAQRITGRSKMLYNATISPERLSTITNYCRSAMELIPVACDPQTGRADLGDLESKLGPEVIGYYFENPGYLGVIEDRGRQIADLIHGAGGLLVVGVDPISLGVLEPPARYGADIVCGDLQPLGIHMQMGGGQSGFLASADDERIVSEYPSRLFSLTRTSKPGEWGFGDVLYDERTSFGNREKGKEFVGTGTALWAITAGVYLALMGPEGMRQVGRTIMQNARYAMERIGGLEKITVRGADTAHFKEFVVDLRDSRQTPESLNRALLERGMIGGIDLTGRLDGYDGCALFCVTEMHRRKDLDRLAETLNELC